MALFRVLQESLTNVSKHCGPGTAVEVSLGFAPGEARLRVTDRGPGFALEGAGRDGHYGLANMRERANKVGGEILIRTAPGQGTTIGLTVDAMEEREA